MDQAVTLLGHGFEVSVLSHQRSLTSKSRRLCAVSCELRTSICDKPLTIYDAAYIALAEALEVPFLTGDRQLSRSPNLRCVVEVISTPFAELPDGF